MKIVTYLLISLILLATLSNFENCNSLTYSGSINGKINLLSERCDYNYERFELTSTGGFVHPAIQISNKIKLNNTTTVVVDDCSSSCLLMSSSGLKRYICRGARIGLHASDTKRGTRGVTNFFKEDPRVNHEYINNIIINTPNHELYLMSEMEAVWAGLADEVIFC